MRRSQAFVVLGPELIGARYRGDLPFLFVVLLEHQLVQLNLEKENMNLKA